MATWDDVPDRVSIGAAGYVVALVRAATMVVLLYGLLVLLWVIRLFEWPFGVRRYSPYVVPWACRGSLAILGVRLNVEGQPMKHKGAVVSIHASWLDIFSLNAPQRVFFVSKSEVSSWPGIGVLARSTGTVFIERKSSHARTHRSQFEERLLKGDRLCFFPEGTSTDSRRMLPFKSTLFAAFFGDELVDDMWIQPVTLNYAAPPGQDPRFFGWWGDMDFSQHLIKSLALGRGGRVGIVFHDPVKVSDFADRKALAQHCETVVKSAFDA